MLDLPAHSNVGEPGVWVFEVTQNVTGIIVVTDIIVYFN